MKWSLLFVFAITLLILSLLPSNAAACAMQLTPTAPLVAVGDIVAFRLERTAIHRVCVLPIEQTTIRVTGGEVVDPGIWEKGKPDVLKFKVKFTQVGAATVWIERECSKAGLQTTQTTVQVGG